MTRIGIRELKNQASRIIREVREERTEYVVTHQGHPVAVLFPYTEQEAQKERRLAQETSLQAMRDSARQVARAWISSKSGVEILDEQRR